MDVMKTAMKDVEEIRQTRQAQSAYAGMLAQGNSVPESPDPDVTTSEGRARIHALVRSLPGAQQAKIYAFGILCRVQGITPEDAGNLPPFGNKLAGMRTREEVADFLMNCLTSVYEKDGHASGTRRFVARILRWVEEDYADPELSLKTIAEQKLFMNTDYVSREFLRETGEKFSQALIRTRMERAKELMRERAWDAKIYEIAEQVGCSNAQYFAQAFKKYTGVTPTGYMEAQRTGGGIKSC